MPEGSELNSLDGVRGACRGREGRKLVVRKIGREELKTKLDRRDGIVLVDTLENKYYRHSHLRGAINLPADEVAERAAELLPDKDAEIVVYCLDPP